MLKPLPTSNRMMCGAMLYVFGALYWDYGALMYKDYY